MRNKLIAGVVSAACATILMTGTASAGHRHFVVIENPATGMTTCQYVGHGQTAISAPQHGGYHRIHDNVHTGTPGTDDRGTTFDKEANQGNHDCDLVRRP